MKRILLTAAAIAASNLFALNASAGYVNIGPPSYNTTTLNTLLPGGAYTGATNSPLTFTQFGYINNNTDQPVSASDVTVSGTSSPGETGISFQGGWGADAGFQNDYKLQFAVTSSAGPIDDITLSVVGNTDSRWDVSESVYAGGFGGTLIGRIEFNNTTTTTQIVTGLAALSGGATTLYIEKDMFAKGVGGNYPEFSVVNQGFSTGAVPEPASMALLGIGLTGLLAYRRRFKKASV